MSELMLIESESKPATREEMLARISLLSSEIDANEEENKMMQDKIYQKAIDAIRDVQPVPIERPDQSVLIPPLTVRDFVQAIVNLKNDKRQ